MFFRQMWRYDQNRIDLSQCKVSPPGAIWTGRVLQAISFVVQSCCPRCPTTEVLLKGSTFVKILLFSLLYIYLSFIFFFLPSFFSLSPSFFILYRVFSKQLSSQWFNDLSSCVHTVPPTKSQSLCFLNEPRLGLRRK